jgi:cytoskeletal protein RodZ
MENVMNAESDSNQEGLLTIMSSLMVLMVILGLITVLCSVLLVISKRQEAMLETLLRQSGERQDTSVLINPETRSQVGSYRSGSERSQAR